MANRKYPIKDVKLLWGLSAGRCAHCKQPCIAEGTTNDRAAIIGQIAHIVAHSNEGPRANPSMSAIERDRYENWILLCSTHHDLVDMQASTYTVEELQTWKNKHEEWICKCLEKAIPSVTFTELEIVTHTIVNLPCPEENELSFQLTSPKEKMAKNDLSERIYYRITLGLSKAREVQQFVEHMAMIQPAFPEKLKAGFIKEYKRLMQEGLIGDALFEGLHEFAAPGSKSFEHQSAGLAVLAYLFEKCDVFEP
jgi:hypothetical protein